MQATYILQRKLKVGRTTPLRGCGLEIAALDHAEGVKH